MSTYVSGRRDAASTRQSCACRSDCACPTGLARSKGSKAVEFAREKPRGGETTRGSITQYTYSLYVSQVSSTDWPTRQATAGRWHSAFKTDGASCDPGTAFPSITTLPLFRQ